MKISKAGQFNEGDHPRADNGEFGEGSGGSSGGGNGAKASGGWSGAGAKADAGKPKPFAASGGKTQSGKEIHVATSDHYQGLKQRSDRKKLEAVHDKHKGFTAQDHRDAEKHHNANAKQAEAAGDKSASRHAVAANAHHAFAVASEDRQKASGAKPPPLPKAKPPPLPPGHGLRDATADAKQVKPRAPRLRDATADAKLVREKKPGAGLRNATADAELVTPPARPMSADLNRRMADHRERIANIKAKGEADRAKMKSDFEEYMKQKRQAAVGKADSTYAQEFRDKARAQLPSKVFHGLHVQARGAAGGRKSRPKPKPMGTLRAVTFSPELFSGDESQAWGDENNLPSGEWTVQSDGSPVKTIAEADPATASEVDLAPGVRATFSRDKGKMGSRQFPKSKLAKFWRALLGKGDEVAAPEAPPPAPVSKAAMAQALEDSMMTEALRPDFNKLVMAQRLVAGMDHQMGPGGMGPAQARRQASRDLAYFPTTYDSVLAGSDGDTGHLEGVDLDLACGAERAIGALGLDTFPYDHGVIIHDVTLGLPFEDGTARNIWFAAPSDWDPNDTEDLIQECQRVLLPGGRLHLQGVPDNALGGLAFAPLPAPDMAATWSHFARVTMKIPVFDGAGDDWTITDDWLPVEAQRALLDQRSAPADVAMANFVGKNHIAEVHEPGLCPDVAPSPVMRAMGALLPADKVVPILKADAARQLVYGVVLAPNEIDTQNDFMTAADIEQAAHKYLSTSRVVGSEHGKAINATPVESFIAPSDMDFSGPHGAQTVTRGSWVLAVKIHDEDLWQKVVDGDYTGFSVGGFGIRDPDPAIPVDVDAPS